MPSAFLLAMGMLCIYWPFEQKEHFPLKEQNGLVWNLAYVRKGPDGQGDQIHNLQVGS